MKAQRNVGKSPGKERAVTASFFITDFLRISVTCKSPSEMAVSRTPLPQKNVDDGLRRPN
jgi:hypothetical protein